MPRRPTKLIAALAGLALLLLASLALNWETMTHRRLHAEAPPSRTPFVAGKCREASLVGHWDFENLSRERRLAADQSGYGNHARLEVADRLFASLRYSPPAQVEGANGSAVELNGRQWLGAGN